MLRYTALIAATAAVFSAPPPAQAQQDPAADYPNRPVKIIVSVPAGGGVDAVTRIFAARLQQRLGQPFVIENRGGGGGNIGAPPIGIPGGGMAPMPPPPTDGTGVVYTLGGQLADDHAH